MITDTWGDEVITADDDEMEDQEHNIVVTKEKLSEITQKARSLIRTFRRSQILTTYLTNERNKTKIGRRIRNDCITRWNSTYLSLESLLVNKPMVLHLFENKRNLPILPKQKEKLTSLELSTDEWAIIDQLVKIFEPFYQATNLLSGSKYPTIGLCLFTMRSIKEFIETDDENQSSIMFDLKKLVSEALEQYFHESDQQSSLLMVSNLD